MENQNQEYGKTDPDFIDQNTLVDGNYIQDKDQYKKQASAEEKKEFGESDPDYIEQNTLVDNDNYARDEDPYQYQEEFVEDLKHPENDFEINKNNNSDKNLQTDNIINKEDILTNDEQKSNLNKDQD
ncbi:hypothetical protein [Flavobacterium sp. N1736]|uniref:hypothetical protein n=1 Tax=Flavobacterium sp. N1736 TaxID=2986823 RepID=UPI002224C7C6|nr:hypothetical protein [Flavobacterium sp. N1736]